MILIDVVVEVFVFVLSSCHVVSAADPTTNCRSRSHEMRQDGGSCFEIAPWQLHPVQLEQHLRGLRARLGNSTRRQTRGPPLELANTEISRYMDTVLAPFLDTYHRNMQNSYQHLTGNILRRIKHEINTGVVKKNNIYTELTELADSLQVPEMCRGERRAARTLANKHVATVHACTEEASSSIGRMGNYAEEMITITRSHMHSTLEDVAKMFARKNYSPMHKSEVERCMRQLSGAAVSLGYELDLSLSVARRHNEQACERLTQCTNKARRYIDDEVQQLKEHMYQCVYA